MESCGCPHEHGVVPTSPLCPIESVLNTGDDSIVFVRRPSTSLQCGFLKNFGMGDYCTNEARGRIFQVFRI